MIRYILTLSLLIQVAIAGLEREPNNSFENAQEIFSNDEMIGERVRAEYLYDYYTFVANKQSFKLSFSTQEEQVSYTIYIYNQQQKEIGRYSISKGGGSLEKILGVLKGRIYIKIYAYNRTNSKGIYQLGVDTFEERENLDLYEIEPNNTLATSHSILLNKVYNGYREQGNYDYDFYKLDNKNSSLSILFSTPEEYINFSIKIYDRYQREIKRFSVPAGELEFSRAFSVPLGSLYMRVYGYNRTASSGSYQVSLNNLSTTDCSVASLLSNSIYNGSWSSSCLSNDRSGAYAKNFNFTISSARNIEINLKSRQDTYMKLFDKNGVEVAFNDDSDGSTNSKINMFLQSGEYKIEATTYYPNTLGDFTIKYSAK